MIDRLPAALGRSARLRAALLFAPTALLAACNTAPQSSPRAAPQPSPQTAAIPRSDPQTAPAGEAYPHRARHRSRHSTPASDTPGQFDYYLLDLSWSPEYCHSHSTAPECANRSTFVLHGLWPQNTDGTYPEACSNAPGPTNPSQYSDLYPSPGLLEHEWTEHGTCSGLSPDQFFTDARTAFHSVRIPPTFQTLTTTLSLSPDAILTQFTQANPGLPRASLALSCGSNYLTAVEICLDKNLHPTACGQIHSCSANTVRIPPPQS